MDELLTFYNAGAYQKKNNIGSTAIELSTIFKERVPYLEVETINGICYDWTKEAIYLFRVAMSIENLNEMSESEKTAWYRFVDYQDGELVYESEAMERMDDILINLVDCVDTKQCVSDEAVVIIDCNL